MEFEYGEEGEGVEDEGADWSAVVVPAALHTRLREAAELYSVTELESCFGELERLGEERLAGHLRGLRRRHDIEAILAVLQEMNHE